MSNTGWKPAVSAYSRVFTIKFRARADHEPKYQACLKGGPLDKSFGDIEKIECPDPERYGDFIEVGRIQGAEERAGTSLSGRYARDIEDELLHLAQLRCALDVQLHLGACTDPRVFNQFEKDVVLEDVYLTNWSSEDIGAISSDENAAVNKSSDLSAGKLYEVLPLTFAEKAADIMVNEVVDVVICDAASCGDECADESQGCEKIYELVGATEGSPGTAPDIKYSVDKGLNWALDEISSLEPDEAADALACVEEYVVVVSEDAESLSYKTKADINNAVVGGWTEVTTGFVAGSGPLDIWSVGTSAFIVGEGGYVYYCADPTAGVTVLDAGIATNNNLNAVHALDDEMAVAVGESDIVVYTTNRVTWEESPAAPTSGGNLQAVWMWSQDVWWVVSSNGQVWYTLDAGVTWAQKLLPGNISALHDIAFSTRSVGAICGCYQTDGRAWRTFNGGYSWTALPEGSGALPEARDLNALALCKDDVNFMVLVGEGEAENDGINIIGED